MGILGWIVVGFVAGAFARAVTGTRWRIGIGIIGGLVGGTIFNLAGDDGIGEFGFRSIFVAFIGACILLLVVGLFADRGRRRY